MKVRTIRAIRGGDYIVTIRTEEFSDEELRWINEKGQPSVQTGGPVVFAEGEDPVELSPKLSGVLSGFQGGGLSATFSPQSLSDPRAVAIGWETLVADRILAAMITLKDSIDSGFSGESVFQPAYS